MDETTNTLTLPGKTPGKYDGEHLVTIEAASTQDIDDAISVSKIGDDYRLLVMIADPTKLVRVGSTEDGVARLMGATVYSRDIAVKKMLPMRISEQEGSLVAGRARQVFAMDILLDADLNLKAFELSRTRIKVGSRLSYEDIPQILQDPANPLRPMIGLAAQLARLLLQKRRQSGALALYDLTRLLMTDEEGRLIQLNRADEVVGHIIVQEFMVLANTVVAGYMLSHNIPGIFRNHEPSNATPPSDELARTIETWLISGGMDTEQARQQFVQIAGRASYSDKLKGHFALAVGCYGHFTSPLRRYADLVNLRQIKAFLKGQPFPHAAEELGPLAESLNLAAEQRKTERSQGFKDTVRRSAERALDNDTLHRLADHELVQACKMAGSAGGLPESLTTELIRRLDGALLTDKVTDCLAISVPQDYWSAELKAAFSKWLHSAPTRSMHLIYHAEQTGTLKKLSVIAEGTGTAFVATVTATRADGTRMEELGHGSRKKDAEQSAATLLLCQLLGLPADRAAAHEAKPAIVGNPKGALLEFFQKRAWPAPTFESSGQGPSHAMVFSATATAMVKGKPLKANATGAANKKEAEALASMQMLEKLIVIV